MGLFLRRRSAAATDPARAPTPLGDGCTARRRRRSTPLKARVPEGAPVRRRSLLATVATVGAAGVAGCGTLRTHRTLTDPTRAESNPARASLTFDADGSAVASLGVRARSDDDRARLDTELSHAEGTTLTSIRYRVWMPDSTGNTPPTVAVVSPVEGDTGPPPTLTLDTPDRGRGTAVTVEDLGDLADETVSTLDLLVDPVEDNGNRIALATTIGLHDGGTFGTRYTLEGRLALDLPALATA